MLLTQSMLKEENKREKNKYIALDAILELKSIICFGHTHKMAVIVGVANHQTGHFLDQKVTS